MRLTWGRTASGKKRSEPPKNTPALEPFVHPRSRQVTIIVHIKERTTSKFSVNFLVDPEEKTHGCWVVCCESPCEIIEATWADEEEPPQAMYPAGWTVQPYSHTELQKALAFFWEIVEQFEWKLISGKDLEKLWFGNEPRTVPRNLGKSGFA
jgi:hypothetical protein